MTSLTVLVLRFSAMGDVAMTLPVVRQVLEQHPHVRIILATRSAYAPIFPTLDRLTVIGLDLDAHHKGLSGLWNLYRTLKRQSPDAVADLHNVLRTRILDLFFRMSGLRTAIMDKGRDEKAALTRREGKILVPLKSMHERYAEVFGRLGLPTTLSPSIVPCTSPVSEDLRIGLAPFAAHAPKMWALHRSIQLIHKLRSDLNARIDLYGGGGEEAAILAKIADDDPGVHSYAEESLATQLDRMSKLHLMISMDSANAHLAANVGIPVLSIWGATHPYIGFAAYGQPTDYCVQRLDLDCRPCSTFGQKPCWRGDLACLDISVDNVFAQVCDVLGRS